MKEFPETVGSDFWTCYFLSFCDLFIYFCVPKEVTLYKSPQT